MKRVLLTSAGACLLAPLAARAQNARNPIVIEAQQVPQPNAQEPAPQGRSAQQPAAAQSAPGNLANGGSGGTSPQPMAGSAEPAQGEAEAQGDAGREASPIVITVTPRSGPVSPPGYSPSSGARGYGYSYGYGYMPVGETPSPYGHQSISNPDTPEALANIWSRRLALGGTFGIGSPLGVLGAFVEYNLSRLIGLTTGVGIGGTFGPAIAAGAYVRPTTWGRWAPVVGLGYSMNFTPGRFFNDPYIRAPGLSHWTNLEAGMEYRSPRGVLFRMMLGHTIMLNTGDFTNQDYMGRYGPLNGPNVGFDPVSAADAHDEGMALHFTYFHVDLGFLFNL